MNKFFDNGNYVQRAHIHSVPPDSFHLSITSQLLTAKHPDEQHSRLSAFLDRQELTKLRDIIDLRLLETA